MKILFLSLIILTNSCSIIDIKFEDGKKPKVKIDLPGNSCKVRVKKSKQKIECEWEF